MPSVHAETHVARSMAELVYVFGPQIGAHTWKIWSDRYDTFSSLWGEVHAHEAAGVKFFQGPGAITTLDAMTIGRQPAAWHGEPPMTESQHRMEVFLYAVLASPMVLSFDLSTVPPILLNPEILAIQEDPDVVSASLVNGYPANPVGTNIYIRPLSDGTFAVALINIANVSQTMTLELKPPSGKGPFTGGPDPGCYQATVRDVYARKDLGLHTRSFNTSVGAMDGRLLRLTFCPNVPAPMDKF